MDVVGRADRLRAVLARDQVPALLVTSLTNIRYLTGFTGSAALLLVTEGALTFVTDGRYGTQAEAQLGAAEVRATIEVTSAGQPGTGGRRGDLGRAADL
jgi:Xaa-Pro aminopeptidase